MRYPLPEPEPGLPFVTARYVPPDVSTTTGSLNLTLACNVPPSDLSKDVVINSISVISAAPNEADSPPIATKTSSSAEVLSFPDNAEPASLTQPFVLAKTSFFSP